MMFVPPREHRPPLHVTGIALFLYIDENLKVQQMSWLLGRKSKLSLENGILVYYPKTDLDVWNSALGMY
jgi:hypothetical protein